MRLKTYVVNNMTEAIPMIKRDLGPDALILNTKQIKTGGYLGFFKKEKLEVIAAVEPTPSEPKRNAESIKPQIQAVEKKMDEDIQVNENESVMPGDKQEEHLDELMSELKSLKQFMFQAIDEDRLPEALKALNKKFNAQGITEEVQSEIMAKLMLVLEKQPNTSGEKLQTLAKREIIKLINAHKKRPSRRKVDIICFIGPTGVGKTTTIAKIAADYLLSEDKKVGLITSDTYRIAAVEQLKTYAGILNIPIRVVESSADLSAAMDDLSDCDIILMDTAGRNYQQKQYIDDLKQMLPDSKKIQINLVLSLTSKYEDMTKIIDNFETIVMDQLILTKKDETSSSGAILNLIYHYSIPIRYIANGQSVPDDILTVTPELIANFVLEEDENV
ncbi:flagellar biosynthesis protein FlhF [Paenisporosarcina quisquiliarum]|uniref:Flagellar biosynthesis protein FlhF n=1 Tax=Paenisporosarcina quisquiliarum TaxID=365346 RepID=A0A9X3RCW4_9BACL|nr:flagellar biosynthesis protein FlhF [Paenisporosarcina quisquiliarum]MCZ8536896.1 flagellar biosynthesis protein FlhF [Paenisporosarcina quisquiliarum]